MLIHHRYMSLDTICSHFFGGIDKIQCFSPKAVLLFNHATLVLNEIAVATQLRNSGMKHLYWSLEA